MKLLTILLPLVFMLAAVGCKSSAPLTTTQKYIALESAEDALLQGVVIAGQDGILTKDDLNKIIPPIDAVIDGTVDAANRYKASTQPTTQPTGAAQ